MLAKSFVVRITEACESTSKIHTMVLDESKRDRRGRRLDDGKTCIVYLLRVVAALDRINAAACRQPPESSRLDQWLIKYF